MWLNTNCVRSDIEALNIRCYFHKCYVIVCVCVSFLVIVLPLLNYSFPTVHSLCLSPLLFSPLPPISVSQQPVDHSLPVSRLLPTQQLCVQLPAQMAAQPNHQPGERCFSSMVSRLQLHVWTRFLFCFCFFPLCWSLRQNNRSIRMSQHILTHLCPSLSPIHVWLYCYNYLLKLIFPLSGPKLWS